MTVVAVSDTGPLIHLREIRSLELLDAFDRLYVPETVYDELEVDSGERTALSVANEREAVLLIDDLAGRDAAVEHGIEVHGSLGVIAIEYAHGLVDRDEAATLMRALQRETSLFVTEAIVEREIRKLEE